MKNLKIEELVQQKEALENLYNRYLLEILPLAKTAEKIKNVEATMKSLDEVLYEVDKLLTVELVTGFEVVEEEAQDTESEEAETNTQTAHYLQQLQGISNFVGTKIETVVKDENNKYQVKIYSKVNTDMYNDISNRKVWTETTYNFKTGKMKTKATQYNYRKDIKEAKEQIEMLIAHTIEENRAYKEDLSEALKMTTFYYYKLLKAQGYESGVTNQLDVLVNIEGVAVQQVEEWINNLLIKEVA